MARRMEAILAADIVGYIRLAATEEERAHARLKAHPAELIDTKIGGWLTRLIAALTRLTVDQPWQPQDHFREDNADRHCYRLQEQERQRRAIDGSHRDLRRRDALQIK